MGRAMARMGRSLGLPIIALCFAVGLDAAAWAEPLPLFYQGVRPLGMGGAFTAVADDENAMFYNPAGLNNIKGDGPLDPPHPPGGPDPHRGGVPEESRGGPRQPPGGWSPARPGG